MIDKVISAAIKLWLRSQVERVEDLQVKINGGDRQILKGYIPSVFLASSCGVYQGLHLRQIELKGANIGFNLTEVLKRKPLRLLEPVLVDIEVLLEEQDLQASLDSPLLASGLTDFLSSLLSAQGVNNPKEKLADCKIDWQEISFAQQRLNLRGTLIDPENKIIQVDIAAGLKLVNSNTLSLSPLIIKTTSELSLDPLHQLEIDLGTEVAISQLSLEGDQLFCSGKITINN